MGLYFDEQEIIPFLMGDYRFNKAGERVTKFTSLEVEVRALIEGQFIAKRAYAEDIGFKIGLYTDYSVYKLCHCDSCKLDVKCTFTFRRCLLFILF